MGVLGHDGKPCGLLTFIVESIDPIDAGALMVASQEEKVLWVFDLVGQKKAYGFQRLLAYSGELPELFSFAECI